MKKTVLIGVVVIFLLPCFAWAGEIDGIWWNPEMGAGSIFMMRESGGIVVAAELGLSRFGESYDYCLLIGTQAGDSIVFNSSAFCPNSITATVMIMSPNEAMVHIDQCSPRLDASCLFPEGTVFNIERAF